MESEPKKDNGEKPKDNNGDENKDDGNEQEGENIYLGVKDTTVRVSVNVYPDEWEDFEEYVLTCDVTFENERLKNIEVIEVEDETNLFYCMKSLTGMGDSKGLLEQFMLFDNTSDVVSVSGATCSSVAFKEAVKGEGAYLIDCQIAEDDKVWPMVAPGASIETCFDSEDALKK